MRIEIDKQQTKRIIVHFSCQEREKKEKKHKQSITNNNPTIICLHASHHVKECMVANLIRRWIARFFHRKASNAPP